MITPEAPAALPLKGAPPVARRSRFHGVRLMTSVSCVSGGAARGFTLVELCVVLALAGLLAAMAWPSWQAQLQRGQRADAVTALMRVQLAQESYRAHHGLYAAQLNVLRGAATTVSGQGLYDIELTGGGDRYEARARARAGSAVSADRACAVLQLQVRDGLSEYAPSARCWNR
jgi:type IV pilus assembly protein PilE